MAVKTKWLLSSDCPSSCTMTGVWRAVAYDQGCVVIFHSPAGCAHVASTMDLGNHYRITADGCPEKGTRCLSFPLIFEKRTAFSAASKGFMNALPMR